MLTAEVVEKSAESFVAEAAASVGIVRESVVAFELGFVVAVVVVVSPSVEVVVDSSELVVISAVAFVAVPTAAV